MKFKDIVIQCREILNQKFFDQSYEVIFRSLSDLIKIVGKKYYSVRGKKLDRIISNIKNKSKRILYD